MPLANVLTTATGSWNAVFIVAAALNIVAAVMALGRAQADAGKGDGAELRVLRFGRHSRWATTIIQRIGQLETCEQQRRGKRHAKEANQADDPGVSATGHRDAPVPKNGLFMARSLRQ